MCITRLESLPIHPNALSPAYACHSTRHSGTPWLRGKGTQADSTQVLSTSVFSRHHAVAKAPVNAKGVLSPPLCFIDLETKDKPHLSNQRKPQVRALVAHCEDVTIHIRNKDTGLVNLDNQSTPGDLHSICVASEPSPSWAWHARAHHGMGMLRRCEAQDVNAHLWWPP